MTFPSERKQILLGALRVLTPTERAKFSAWCLYYFETDPGIIIFFEKVLGGQAKNRVASLARRLWSYDGSADITQSDLSFLEVLDWDVDAVSESDIDVSQGLTDYLAAAAFAVKGVLTGREEDIYACSENVINRLDYLMSFNECETNEDLVEAEFESQVDFLRSVSSGQLKIDWSR